MIKIRVVLTGKSLEVSKDIKYLDVELMASKAVIFQNDLLKFTGECE